MKAKIRNIDELRTEIIRLQEQRSEMEADMQIEVNKLVSKIKLPLMLFGKMSEWATSLLGVKSKNDEASDSGDWVSGIFKMGLPFLMNRFVFPKSGFLAKTVLGLITERAAGTINKDLLSSVISKIADTIKGAKRRKKDGPELDDYGIPPDSETY